MDTIEHAIVRGLIAAHFEEAVGRHASQEAATEIIEALREYRASKTVAPAVAEGLGIDIA